MIAEDKNQTNGDNKENGNGSSHAIGVDRIWGFVLRGISSDQSPALFRDDFRPHVRLHIRICTFA